MSTVNEQVAAGAALLDQLSVGWERKIDLSVLDIQDSCRCILGQVYGAYSSGLVAIARPVRGVGFNVGEFYDDDAGRVAAFAALDEAWISLIKERFNTGALSDSV